MFGGLISGAANAASSVADGVSNAFGGGGSGGGAGGPQVDFDALAGVFAKATADTQKITEITTEGNVAKDAAQQRPR